uniref:Uncharacterized protein n=2 Tax=Photinus pyralis TaxID=7054 RepID=A0A1Y1MH57_PHOPY
MGHASETHELRSMNARSARFNMADESLTVASASFIVICKLLKQKRRRQRRRWTSQLYMKRGGKNGINSTLLLNDLSEEGTGHFKNFTRMSQDDFNFLLNAIKTKIMRRDTVFRKAVSVEERLAVTLRFLATGDSYTSLQYLFRISKQLISQIIPEVCQALIECLIDHVKLPASEDEWKNVAQKFEDIWNFPHCVGAIDGKHVVVQAPIKSGSDVHNYKSFFSIVLMALVDADYNFMFVDIGCQGRISDGGVFQNCQLYKKIANNALNQPTSSPLIGRTVAIPFVFLGDAAFPLSEHIMKPYAGQHPKESPERIFNYRLSRARRVVENAFGIASSVFRVLRKPILLEPEKAQLIVMTVVCLHNFLRRSQTSRNIYTPPGCLDSEVDGNTILGNWRTDNQEISSSLLPVRNIPRRSKPVPTNIRLEFTEYFCSNGAVPWQSKCA